MSEARRHITVPAIQEFALKTVAVRHNLEPREAEREHCRRCGRTTEQYAVYWYTLVWTYDPPIECIDGTVIAQIRPKIFVSWCFDHRGKPPLRYTDKPIPPGGFM